MGTNFYFVPKPLKCPTCGREGEKIHIGKSSYGWSFSFQGYPDLEIMSYQDWIRKFLSSDDWMIVDEYHDECSVEDFNKMVQHKKDDKRSAVMFSGSIKQRPDEKAYYEERKYLQAWPQNTEDYWVDDEGHGFTSQEFF